MKWETLLDYVLAWRHGAWTFYYNLILFIHFFCLELQVNVICFSLEMCLLFYFRNISSVEISNLTKINISGQSVVTGNNWQSWTELIYSDWKLLYSIQKSCFYVQIYCHMHIIFDIIFKRTLCYHAYCKNLGVVSFAQRVCARAFASLGNR